MSVEYWTTHSLDKLFPQSEMPARAAREIRLKAAGNESEDAQIVVRPTRTLTRARVSFTHLQTPGGSRIDAGQISGHWQWYTYVLRNPPHSKDPSSWLRDAPNFFPDAFVEDEEIRIASDWTQAMWVRIRIPAQQEPGEYHGRAMLCYETDDGERAEQTIPISLTVWPFSLPGEKSFRHTEWFSARALATWYNLKEWSEEHWEWIEKCAMDMFDHHQDTILTSFHDLVTVTEKSAGTWDFDFTQLDRWIELFRKHGVTFIECGHIAGQRAWGQAFIWRRFPVFDEAGREIESYGPEQMDERDFAAPMERFLKGIYAHLEERFGLERLMQHIADEPLADNMDSWVAISEQVKSWLPDGIPNIDAVICEELIGKVDIRVPQLQEIKAEAPAAVDEELWSYTCLAPQGHHPNRFLDFESIRNRIIFWINFSRNLGGYLHWGYNQWHPWGPPRPKSVKLSPWTDAAAMTIYNTDWQPLPAGDPHIVYPGAESICSSIRWEVVRKGIEDIELLRMLENAAAAAPSNDPNRNAAAALLDNIRTDLACDSQNYTRSEEDLLSAREQAGDLLARLVS